MNSVTDLLPFCDNSNVCQLIVGAYVAIAMLVVGVVVSAVVWLYKTLVDIKARQWVDLYYGFTDTRQ